MTGEYNIDYIFCIEATSNMKPISEDVNKFVKTLIFETYEEIKEIGRTCNIRTKIILFRDLACCAVPIIESDFFILPEQMDVFFEFVDRIEYKGGYGFCNALEAIALAIKSDWTTGGTRRRHMIVTISNGKVRPLGGNQRLLPNYPSDIPDSLPQLGAWVHGYDHTFNTTYQPNVAKLVAFVPNAEPWVELQAWNSYWPAFWNKDYYFLGFGIQDILCLLLGS